MNTRLKLVFVYALTVPFWAGAQVRFSEHISLEAAKAEAEKSQLPIVAYFYESDCGSCATMNESWQDQEVGRYANSHYVPYRVDVASTQEGGLEVGNQFRVNLTPTLIFLSPKGEVLHRLEGVLLPEYLLANLRTEYNNFLYPQKASSHFDSATAYVLASVQPTTDVSKGSASQLFGTVKGASQDEMTTKSISSVAEPSEISEALAPVYTEKVYPMARNFRGHWPIIKNEQLVAAPTTTERKQTLAAALIPSKTLALQPRGTSVAATNATEELSAINLDLSPLALENNLDAKYSIQVAAYSSLTNLKRRVLELQQRGEKELLYTQNDNGVYQLMIGRFENQADAQVTYQRVVLELEVNDPYLVSLQTIR